MRPVPIPPPLTRDYVDVNVGARVRKVREDFRIDPAMLAHDIGLPGPEALLEIEDGRRSLDMYQLCRLCSLFAKKIYFFFDWPRPKEEITDDDVPF